VPTNGGYSTHNYYQLLASLGKKKNNPKRSHGPVTHESGHVDVGFGPFLKMSQVVALLPEIERFTLGSIQRFQPMKAAKNMQTPDASDDVSQNSCQISEG
jgi:hypothetical protein